MKLAELVILYLFASVVIVSARYVDDEFESSEKVEMRKDIGRAGVRSRVRRGYGCGVWSSNNAECNMHCKFVEKCSWGQCEGWAKQLCRCRNANNSYC